MKKLAIFFSVILLLVSCGMKSDNHSHSHESNELIEARIQIQPENVVTNESTTIEVYVTQGEESVDDAEEVEFEIWMDGQEEHERINGKNNGEGLYSINHIFEEKGTYFVLAHVTARGMHTMPKVEITVSQ